MIWYPSTGILKYDSSSQIPYRLVLEVDPDIAKYYRALIPFWMKVNRPKFAPHISIVRQDIFNLIPDEDIRQLEYWNKYPDREIEFEYQNHVFYDEVYYWLAVRSDTLHQIRMELGLPPSSQITRSPTAKQLFHLTIGNRKS